jgi:predicted ATPase
MQTEEEQEGGENNDTMAETRSNMILKISKVNKELVFIKGVSGVGKSSLARVIKRDVDSVLTGHFAEGKFDLNDSRDQPYSGIAKAYSELIRALLRADRGTILRIGETLCTMLGSEVEPLTYLIPELEEVVSES